MNKSKFDKKYILQIKKYFEAPSPQGKSAFLDKYSKKEELDSNRISLPYMVFVQISYISKWMWVFSALIFLCMLIISKYLQRQMLWTAFALMPFIVTFSLSESMRSVVYGMGEFEMAARFSLKSIIMSRLIILGIGNMFLLFVFAMFLGEGIWRNIVYMLVPYLSSATGGLMILRKFTSKEGVYISCGFSSIISGLCLTGVQSYRWIYETRYTSIWIVAAISLFISTSYECLKTADAVGSSF